MVEIKSKTVTFELIFTQRVEQKAKHLLIDQCEVGPILGWQHIREYQASPILG